MFSEVDQDGSGYITFDELENVVRQTLRKGVKVISDNVLKALWCTLDKDDSNSVEKDEMSAFFRLGAPAVTKKPPPPPKEHTSANILGAGGAMERHGMGSAIASTPTSEMRAELEEAGVELLDEEQLQTLSEYLNVWLEEHRENVGKERSVSWFNLFAEVDQDGSGFITFDELEDVVRRTLKKGTKVISKDTLKALWCTLDKDDSNSMEKEEMAGFFKRGAAAVAKKAPPPPKEHTSASLLGAGGAFERHGMGGAIASTPTSEMREELEVLGVSLPTDDELTELSTKLNKWLEDDRELNGRGSVVTWFNLFAEVDQDGSGFITYDELEDVIRHKLRKGQKVISDISLKALWCTLDKDDSNSVEKDEMASFFKRGAPAVKKKPPPPPKEYSTANLVGAMERHGMGGAIASTPTSEMRVELEDAGVWLPSEKELVTISVNLNTWLEDCRVLHGRGSAVTWFNLFAEVDQDGSGYITYDEIRDVIRHKLHKGPKVMSENAIKALWCTLDQDDSNSVEKDEMAAFFKLGAPAVHAKKQEKKEKEYTTANLLGAGGVIERHGMGSAIASTPTSEMLEELKKAEVPLPDEKRLTALSKKLNVWLEEVRELHGRGSVTTWFNLFAEVDVDGSGYITFDELLNVIRRKLKKGAKVLSANEIKALWCALDINCSNTVEKDEMAAFFKRGAPSVRKKQASDKKKEYTSANLLGAGGAIERHGMGNAIASTPTRVMHAELEEAGVALPDADEQAALAKKFNQWLETRRRDDGKDKSITWFNLFAMVDMDGSGYVTYDEFTNVVRQKLQVKKSTLSEDTLKALWVVLDADDSNQIMMDEFSNFLRGKPAKPKQRPAPKPTRSPSKSRPQGEPGMPSAAEMEAFKQNVAANYKAMKEAQQQKAIRESTARRARERARDQAARLEKKMRLGRAKLDMQYKRDLLSHMYRSTLRSPIPIDTSGRIGGTRILPLYQSERMLLEMEMNGLQKPWPGNDTPSRPRTASASLRSQFTDELSRLDNLLTPYWLPKMEMQASRVHSPMASRAQSASSLRPLGSHASTPHGSRPGSRPVTSMTRPTPVGTPVVSRAGTAASMRPSASEPRLTPGRIRA